MLNNNRISFMYTKLHFHIFRTKGHLAHLSTIGHLGHHRWESICESHPVKWQPTTKNPAATSGVVVEVGVVVYPIHPIGAPSGSNPRLWRTRGEHQRYSGVDRLL